MDETVKEIIRRKIKDLPTLPTVATQIVSVTNDPDSSVDDLQDVIQTDQVVAGRILRAVNSAYYGFPRKIDTLSKAIVILGFNNVRSLALSVSVMDIFSGKKGSGFNHKELWKRAVGTAFCARALARVNHPRDIEKFFIAGLLHDIGLVAINQCYPKELTLLLHHVKRLGKPLYILEKEFFKFTHAEVGAFMADDWLLPKGLSNAIGLHHNPIKSEIENQPLVYAIHVSDYICKHLKFGDFGDNDPFNFKALFRPAMDMYSLDEAGPDDELLEVINKDMEEAKSFIQMFN